MKLLINKLAWCKESCKSCDYVDFVPDDETMDYCTLYQIYVKQDGKDSYFVRWGEKNEHFQKLVDKIREDLE